MLWQGTSWPQRVTWDVPLLKGDPDMQLADVQESSTGPGLSPIYKGRSYSYLPTSKAFRSALQTALGYDDAIHPPKPSVSWKQQSQAPQVVMEDGMVGGSTTLRVCLETYLPL